MIDRTRLKGFIRLRQGAFTLIELLVVVAIIALLISILLPSLAGARDQAKAAACMANMDQLGKALRMYQDEFRGSLPQSYNKDNPYGESGYVGVGSLWSESAWGVAKRDLWFYKLVPTYHGNPKGLICPADPFARRFDFEKRLDPNFAACGYGMTYFLRHYTVRPTDLMNTDQFGPKRPSNTILLAEVGPDDQYAPSRLMASIDGSELGVSWRDGGRLLWDDGKRSGTINYTGPTWLTTRHRGSINMSSFDYGVRRVDTRAMAKLGPRARYIGTTAYGNDCYGRSPTTKSFTCFLCAESEAGLATPHYNFAKSGLWWWTGKVPGITRSYPWGN